MQEIWKDIPGYEGHYQASNCGNIRSLNYMGHKGNVRVLKNHFTYDGYPIVPLMLNKTKKTIAVHILVAKTFIDNPNNKPQVNHIDGVKTNNCISNLEWVTCKENVQHSIKTGLRNSKNRKYLHGDEHYASKTIYQYDLSGNLVKKWDCISEAARRYSCSPCTLINCSKGRIKSCKGYMWRSFTNNAPIKIKPLVTKDYARILIQKSIDGTIIKEWNGYKELIANTGYRKSSICSACKGRQKTAYGYIWEEKPIPYS